MNKLMITSGMWTIKKWDGESWPERRITIGQKEGRQNCIAISPRHGYQPQVQRDFKAIVTAVNNTYKRGIDPEAVPDMVKALKGVHDALQAKYDDYIDSEAGKLIEQALRKAEL